MIDRIYNNINSLIIIPTIILTILYCIYIDRWHIYMIVPIFICWMIVLIGIISLCFYFKPQFNELTVNEIISELNITKGIWRRSSREKKEQLHFYLMQQNNCKNIIINNKIKEEQNSIKDYKKLSEFYKNVGEYRKILQKEVFIQWKDLSLTERIKLISIEEVKEKKAQELSNIEFKLKSEIYNKNKKKLENEKKIKDKEEEIRIERIKQSKILLEEKLARENEKERLISEQIKRQENLEIQKILNDEKYKERIKRDLLEKERKMKLASEAIEELIENGELSHNFSIKNIRVPIPSHIKDAVWKRDMECCVTCRSNQNLEYDHIIPVAKGGSNTINNIQILCQKCNRTKSSKIM